MQIDVASEPFFFVFENIELFFYFSGLLEIFSILGLYEKSLLYFIYIYIVCIRKQ